MLLNVRSSLLTLARVKALVGRLFLIFLFERSRSNLIVCQIKMWITEPKTGIVPMSLLAHRDKCSLMFPYVPLNLEPPVRIELTSVVYDTTVLPLN